MARLITQLYHAWNQFTSPNRDDSRISPGMDSMGTGLGRTSHNHAVISYPNQTSIVNALYVRLSVDVASVGFRHIKKDEQGRYVDDVDSGLQRCLTVEPNIDQSPVDLVQDIVLTMCDKGYLAIVPVETDVQPNEKTGSFDIQDMRVGEIIGWYPRHVKVRIWNDDPLKGRYEDIIVSKRVAAIVFNPLYSIMNSPNSTLQRLKRKLTLLDSVDERVAAAKLDILFQLPYEVRNQTQRGYAQERLESIEMQLKDSSHGAAWIGSTEKVIQLNRPVENTLLAQVEMLTNLVHAQLGITKGVMEGTASEEEMINYYNRTVDPILRAISQAMHRTFLTKTAQTQGQTVDYFRDLFKVVPLSKLGDLFDKLLRNEVITSNEGRGILGYKPSKDPKADELRNSNLTRAQTGHELSDQAALPDGPTPSPLTKEGETPK